MGFSGAEKVNLLLSLEECSVWVHLERSQATITGFRDYRELNTTVAAVLACQKFNYRDKLQGFDQIQNKFYPKQQLIIQPIRTVAQMQHGHGLDQEQE